jgi:hypothetical protein
LGKQRGAKVAEVDIARRLTEANLAHAPPQPVHRSGRRYADSGRIDGPD